DVLLEQIAEQDRLVAFRTVTAQSQRPTEHLTGWTATLADEALLAPRTLVNGVGSQQSLPLQLATEVRLIRRGRRASPKPVGKLSMGRRTEPGADVPQRYGAHQAPRHVPRCRGRCITRSVTHGAVELLWMLHAEYSAGATASTATRSGRGNDAS